MGRMLCQGWIQSCKKGRLILFNILKICSPKSSKDFDKYYQLRYEILRKPWNQPIGSERDRDENNSIHRMIVDDQTGKVLAVGRLHFNSDNEAQIRYMAVLNKFQGQGLGTKMIAELEEISKKNNIRWIILQSRRNAIQFYKNNGYKIERKTHLLFDEIQHWLMRKKLS